MRGCWWIAGWQVVAVPLTRQVRLHHLPAGCAYSASSEIHLKRRRVANPREVGIIAEDAVLAMIDAVMSSAIDLLQTGKRRRLVNSELGAS